MNDQSQHVSQAISGFASRLKASADPLRLKILQVLQQNSYGVLELCHILAIKQSALSHHLKLLAQAGLVTTRREGNSIFYRRHLKLAAWIEGLLQDLDQLPLDADTEARMTEVHQERSQSSAAFFQHNHQRFRAQQELIASFSQYAPAVVAILDAIHKTQAQRALEVGPGNGELIPELSQRFDWVLALDNNQQMLDSVKQRLQQKQLENVELVLTNVEASDDIAELGGFDAVVINMVLHHLAEPRRIFGLLASMLNSQGVMIVTELSRHDQDWVRTACGDLWLGFEVDDLKNWARSAGLGIQQSQYLALRNGFQVQIYHFFKS